MKCNIYTANHGKRDGIEDFLSIIANFLQKHGHEVDISEELRPEGLNFIIDEFTNLISNQEIVEFRQRHPSATLVYVLTEFVEHRWCVSSFNFFGGPVEAALIAVLNVFVRLRRKDFLPPRPRDWLLALLYSPLLILYVLLHAVKNLRRSERMRMPLSRRLHRTAYMLMRYMGLEKMLGLADCVVLSHGMIEPGLAEIPGDVPVLGTIYPELDLEKIKASLFKNKQLFIEITGSVTPYRRRFIRNIDNNITMFGIKSRFQLCKSISFYSDEGFGDRGAYSLHPPQTKAWKYSSPTRIFRALQYDHNVPVLTKVFGQHPIEKLCLRYQGEQSLLDMYHYYRHPDELMNLLEPLLETYAKEASDENAKLIQAVFAQCETRA